MSGRHLVAAKSVQRKHLSLLVAREIVSTNRTDEIMMDEHREVVIDHFQKEDDLLVDVNLQDLPPEETSIIVSTDSEQCSF